eukprot:gene23765-9323_t
MIITHLSDYRLLMVAGMLISQVERLRASFPISHPDLKYEQAKAYSPCVGFNRPFTPAQVERLRASFPSSQPELKSEQANEHSPFVGFTQAFPPAQVETLRVSFPTNQPEVKPEQANGHSPCVGFNRPFTPAQVEKLRASFPSNQPDLESEKAKAHSPCVGFNRAFTPDQVKRLRSCFGSLNGKQSDLVVSEQAKAVTPSVGVAFPIKPCNTAQQTAIGTKARSPCNTVDHLKVASGSTDASLEVDPLVDFKKWAASLMAY